MRSFDFNGDGIDDFAITGNMFTSVDVYYGSSSGFINYTYTAESP